MLRSYPGGARSYPEPPRATMIAGIAERHLTQRSALQRTRLRVRGEPGLEPAADLVRLVLVRARAHDVERLAADQAPGDGGGRQAEVGDQAVGGTEDGVLADVDRRVGGR